MPEGSSRTDEASLFTRRVHRDKAALPVNVQIGTGDRYLFERRRLSITLTSVTEQQIARPAQRLLARASRAGGMSMKEVRAQLDDESGPHRLRFSSNLDGEVLRLDQVGIAAPT